MSSSLTTRTMFLFARAAFLVLIFCFVANAAGNEVDLSYSPAPSKDLTGTAGDMTLQPDGKIIIFGQFQVVNNTPKVRIGRLNADGTLDNSFTYNASNFNGFSKVVVQPDGKILVSGSDVNLRPLIVRLNSDGSVDGSFTSPFTGPSTFNQVIVYAVQPDGKIFAAASGPTSRVLYRLNSNGSFDNSFTPISFGQSQALRDIILLPNGQLLVAGRHPNGHIFRVNTDGSKDMSFEAPLLANSQIAEDPTADSFARQSDGRILFTGNYRAVNGISREGLTRLNADGTLELTFPQSGFTYDRVKVLSNDKIILGATRRFNSDGTTDNTFTPPASLALVYNWLIDGSDRILISGKFTDVGLPTYRFARLETNGSLDPLFSPIVRLSGKVYVITVQPDGKTLIAGDFTEITGVARRNFARLEANGAVDLSFDVGNSFMTPNAIVVLSNGKILVGGTGPLARLESNGAVDATFVGVASPVYAIAVQPDNKILIGGAFSTVNGVTHKLLGRLNADGTLDAAFNPILDAGFISTLIVQSNGKIMVAGSFAGISGVARSNIARLNIDGSVDTSFNAGSTNFVSAVAVQPDGQYLVAPYNILRRLNVDGSVDNSFFSTTVTHYLPNASINSIKLQSDGSVVIGGNFYQVNGVVRQNLTRVGPHGQLDYAFLPNGTNGSLSTIVAQPDGTLLIGGSFSIVENVERAGIARLNTMSFHGSVPFDYDGDGKADVSVYRPSNTYWYLSRSSDSQFTYTQFGTAGDIPAPADYDGDGRTDLAVFRPATGDFSYVSSIRGLTEGAHWGANGDVPVPSDFDGDGRADYIIYRPTEGNWYRLSSRTLQWDQKYFGAAGDKPIVGDFDGDGKSDPAIFRPSTGTFWYMSSIDSVHRAIPWGTSTDIPAPADYDGDGKTDAAVYRPSTGYWYIYFSGTNTYSFTPFGISEDKPIPADYDGDGKADIAVYRPSTGTWYMLKSTAGFSAQQFGNSTDVPTPNSFIH